MYFISNKRLLFFIALMTSFLPLFSEGVDPIWVKPPRKVTGYQVVNHFVAQTDIVNVVEWSPPSSGGVPFAYDIYRDAALQQKIKRVFAGKNLRFEDHNLKKNQTRSYYIVTVDKNENKSVYVGIVFKGNKTSPIAQQPRVISLQVRPKSEFMAIGESIKCKVIATFEDGTSKDVTQGATWSSSNDKIARVNACGVIQALSEGSAEITVRYGPAWNTVTVVISQKLLSVVIEPTTSQLDIGEGLQCKAFAVFEDGSRMDVTKMAIWNSSDPSIALIDDDGFVEAVSEGSAQLMAEYDVMVGEAELMVAQSLVSIEVFAEKSYLSIGETTKIKAIAFYVDGTQKDVTDVVCWSTNNGRVLKILGIGTVAGIGDGSVTVTASMGYGSIVGTVHLSVGKCAYSDESSYYESSLDDED